MARIVPASILAFALILSIGPQIVQAVPANTISQNSVSPNVGCFACCPVCPLNIWAPYGPFVQKLRFQYYAGAVSEFNGFANGQLDVMDSPQNCFPIACFSNPDWVQSSINPGYTIIGVMFNGAANTWRAWGCDWNTGTPYTTSEQTYVTSCGIDMRQGLAHLVDRVSFAGKISSTAIADPSTPLKDPSASNQTTQCSWDSMFPNCISAFRLAPSTTGFAQPGSKDFCAAANHMIAAGIATGKNPTSCVLTGVNPGVFSHPLRFFYRTTFSRKTLALGFAGTVNQLFGGTAVSPKDCFAVPPIIGSCLQLIFGSPPDDNWDAYTYGTIQNGPLVDGFSTIYSSQQASNYCGGPQTNLFVNNAQIVCVPALDRDINGMNTIDLNSYRSQTLEAFNDLGQRAIEIPAYSINVGNILGLRAAAGLVDEAGVGYTNYWTYLNIHRDPNYVPMDPRYSFGDGDPSTARVGQSNPTSFLNIFNAQTFIEFRALGEVYDTLLAGNPDQPSTIFCWMCTTYSTSVDAGGNTHFLILLRQDLRWHDGQVVDAKDVAFSLLSLRDLSLAAGGLLVGSLQSVNVLGSNALDIVFKGQSVDFAVALETMIIPRHIWECNDSYQPGDCMLGQQDVPSPADYTIAGVNYPSDFRAGPNNSYNFDPLAAAAFIGSGPYVCTSLFPEDFGSVGTGCSVNSDGSRGSQLTDIGGFLQLQAFDFTGRAGNTDPFYQYMRSYNPSWGTGTGTSAESGQFEEFSYADGPNRDGQVTVADIASVAACVGVGPSGTSACPAAAYNYWHRAAFDNGRIGIIELSIVLSHRDETYPIHFLGVQPYS